VRTAGWLALGICLLPGLVLLALSLGDPGYREILAKERQVTLFVRSVWISAAATGLALIWGTLVALGVRSLRGAAGAALEAISLLPLLLPSIVLVMGWIFFFGPSGPLQAVGIKWNIFTEWGAAAVMSMVYYPCVSMLLIQAFRGADASGAAAARLFASRPRALARIWLPYLAPYLATGGVLVFLLSMNDYAVPSALRVNVYPVEIFTQLSAYFDVPRAVAFCLPPFLIAAVLIAARRLLVPPIPESIGGRSRVYDAPRSKGWFLAALPVIAAAVVLPLNTLFATQGSFRSLREALSIAGEQALASLAISSYATIALVGFGLVLALAMRRSGRKSRLGMEMLTAATLIVPGAVVGLGIVVMHTRGWIPASIYRSPASLDYAMLCRFVVFPAFILSASLSAIRPRMIEAADSAGVPRVRSALRIAAPLALPGLVAAATLSFVMCLGELSASALVNPPGQMTLAMRIASLLHFGEDRIVASLCLTLSALVVGVLVLGLLALNRRLEFRLDANRT
jgi:iron(III) transport system permease protein